MELTKEVLNKQRLIMSERLMNAYGRDSEKYQDMMFSINMYYQSLLVTLRYVN